MAKRQATTDQQPWHIKCRVAPIGEDGPLIAQHWHSLKILHLGVLLPHIAKGLNLDGLIDIDMQSDGGVDGIEILQPLGGGLGSITVHPVDPKNYWRLFLEPSDKDVIEKNAIVKMERQQRIVTLRFAPGDIDAKYLIAPGTKALVGANEFRGLEIDLDEFVR